MSAILQQNEGAFPPKAAKKLRCGFHSTGQHVSQAWYPCGTTFCAMGEDTPEIELTREQAQELVEREAQEVLGVSAQEAFAMLDRGELNGTIIQAELSNLRWLLSSDK